MAEETDKTTIDEKLKKYVNLILSSIKVDKIILFGSYAKGNTHEFSDIDLAVISPELDLNKSSLYNLRKVKEKMNLIDPDLQLIAFPTEQFETENTVEKYFIQEIKKTGKLLYSSK